MGKDIDALAELPLKATRILFLLQALWCGHHSVGSSGKVDPRGFPPPRTMLEGSFLCSVEPWGVEIQQLLDTLPKHLPVLPLSGDPCSIRGAREQVLDYDPYSYTWF